MLCGGVNRVVVRRAQNGREFSYEVSLYRVGTFSLV